jgi:adenine phosphoribosyltransferase
VSTADPGLAQACRDAIRDVPDFPKPGILFRDITPLLADGALFRRVTHHFASTCERLGWAPDVLVSPEARGFIFGAALAHELGIGFVPVRKPDKLPHMTHRVSYDLEYGSDAMEMHVDALRPGQRVVVIDDLLATGGTVAASADLVAAHGLTITGALFLVELSALGGRARLAPLPVHALLAYPD